MGKPVGANGVMAKGPMGQNMEQWAVGQWGFISLQWGNGAMGKEPMEQWTMGQWGNVAMGQCGDGAMEQWGNINCSFLFCFLPLGLPI